MNGPYFTGPNREKYYYADIAQSINENFPHLNGKHIFRQIEALGIYEEFAAGETPYGLPFSFTDYLEADIPETQA